MSEETLNLLPLDSSERIATFKSRDKIFRHIFRRLTEKEWGEYFSRISVEWQNEKGGGQTQIVDVDSASLNLYAKAIERVEGYKTRDGIDPKKLPTWPECVPQDHRLRAIDILSTVSRDETADESVLEAETISVSLTALWNEANSAEGAMKQYSGLIHTFSIPTADHRRRLLKARNRTFVAGGSRTGLTVAPSAHPVLLKLYDELIEKVDGYSLGGQPIGREAIAREMDAFHKQIAVGYLFPSVYAMREAEEAAAA